MLQRQLIRANQQIRAYLDSVINDQLSKQISSSLSLIDRLQGLDAETKKVLENYLKIHLRKMTKAIITEVFFIYIFPGIFFTLFAIFELLPLGIFYLQNRQLFQSQNFVNFIPLYICMFIIAILYLLLTYQYVKRHYLEFGRDLIIPIIYLGMIGVFKTLDSDPDVLTRLTTKKKLLDQIESVAHTIQFFLPILLRSGDTVTNVWFENVTRQAAAAIRERKKWILTPKKDTRGYLARSLANMLVCIVEGNWDALEQVELKAIISTKKWYSSAISTLWKILKTIFAAAFPILVLLVYQITFQHTSYVLSGALLVTIISIISVYAAVVVTSTLNPHFKDQFENVKSIRDMLPLPGIGSKS